MADAAGSGDNIAAEAASGDAKEAADGADPTDASGTAADGDEAAASEPVGPKVVYGILEFALPEVDDAAAAPAASGDADAAQNAPTQLSRANELAAALAESKPNILILTPENAGVDVDEAADAANAADVHGELATQAHADALAAKAEAFRQEIEAADNVPVYVLLAGGLVSSVDDVAKLRPLGIDCSVALSIEPQPTAAEDAAEEDPAAAAADAVADATGANDPDNDADEKAAAAADDDHDAADAEVADAAPETQLKMKQPKALLTLVPALEDHQSLHPEAGADIVFVALTSSDAGQSAGQLPMLLERLTIERTEYMGWQRRLAAVDIPASEPAAQDELALYREMMDQVPPSCVSVPLVLICLFEQVVATAEGHVVPAAVADDDDEEARRLLLQAYVDEALGRVEEAAAASSGANLPPVLKPEPAVDGRSTVIVPFGDDIALRQIRANMGRSAPPSTTHPLTGAEREALIKYEQPCELPEAAMSDVDQGVALTELASFTKLDLDQFESALLVKDLEQLMLQFTNEKDDDGADKQKPQAKRSARDWQLSSRVHREDLAPHAMAQTLRSATKSENVDVRTSFNAARDELLVAVHRETPLLRRETVLWKDFLCPDLPFSQWRESRERADAASTVIRISPHFQGNLSSLTKVCFPCDKGHLGSTIAECSSSSRVTLWLEKNGHRLTLQEGAAGLIVSAQFASSDRLAISGSGPDLQLCHTLGSGLCASVATDGQVLQSYPDRAPGAASDVSRAVRADGVAVAHARDGSVTVMYADGAVSVLDPVTRSWERTDGAGKRLRCDADGSTTELRALEGAVQVDPKSRAQGMTREDFVLVMTYEDGSRMAQHADGTRLFTATNGDWIVEAPGFAPVEGKPDGEVKLVLPEGSTTVRKPNGALLTSKPNGARFLSEPSGRTLFFPRVIEKLPAETEARGEAQAKNIPSGTYFLAHGVVQEAADAAARDDDAATASMLADQKMTRDMGPGYISTTDKEGNRFCVGCNGRVSVALAMEQYNVLPGSDEKDFIPPQYYSAPEDPLHPRLFVLRRDGSGFELHHKDDFEAVVQHAAADALVHAVPVEDLASELCPGVRSHKFFARLPAPAPYARQPQIPDVFLAQLGSSSGLAAAHKSASDEQQQKQKQQQPVYLVYRHLLESPALTPEALKQSVADRAAYLQWKADEAVKDDFFEVNDDRSAEEKKRETKLQQDVIASRRQRAARARAEMDERAEHDAETHFGAAAVADGDDEAADAKAAEEENTIDAPAAIAAAERPPPQRRFRRVRHRKPGMAAVEFSRYFDVGSHRVVADINNVVERLCRLTVEQQQQPLPPADEDKQPDAAPVSEDDVVASLQALHKALNRIVNVPADPTLRAVDGTQEPFASLLALCPPLQEELNLHTLLTACGFQQERKVYVLMRPIDDLKKSLSVLQLSIDAILERQLKREEALAQDNADNNGDGFTVHHVGDDDDSDDDDLGHLPPPRQPEFEYSLNGSMGSKSPNVRNVPKSPFSTLDLSKTQIYDDLESPAAMAAALEYTERSFMGTTNRAANTTRRSTARDLDVLGRPRRNKIRVATLPNPLHSARGVPNVAYASKESTAQRKIKTMSTLGRTAHHGAQPMLDHFAQFTLQPGHLRFNLCRLGSTYRCGFTLTNKGSSKGRFQIVQPRASSLGLRVLYKPTAVAPGMSVKAEVEMLAAALGSFLTHIVVKTETHIFKVKVSGKVLLPDEFDVEAPASKMIASKQGALGQPYLLKQIGDAALDTMVGKALAKREARLQERKDAKADAAKREIEDRRLKKRNKKAEPAAAVASVSGVPEPNIPSTEADWRGLIDESLTLDEMKELAAKREVDVAAAPVSNGDDDDDDINGNGDDFDDDDVDVGIVDNRTADDRSVPAQPSGVSDDDDFEI